VPAAVISSGCTQGTSNLYRTLLEPEDCGGKYSLDGQKNFSIFLEYSQNMQAERFLIFSFKCTVLYSYEG
jgi:hypothetical protein